jgi:hypothetical protein
VPMAPAAKLCLLAPMMDVMNDNPGVSDLNVKVKTIEAAKGIGLLQGAFGASGASVAPMFKAGVWCFECNQEGHYSNRCPMRRAGYKGPQGRGGGRGGYAGQGRGAGYGGGYLPGSGVGQEAGYGAYAAGQQ